MPSASITPRAVTLFDSGGSQVVLVNAKPGTGVDGIDTYSRQLARALTELGTRSAQLTLTAGGWLLYPSGLPRSSRVLSPADLAEVYTANAVVVQYNPFSWGRRGFAPALLWNIAKIRRRRPRPTIGLMVHERYVPMDSLRRAAMGAWQRFQLQVLSAQTDARFVSTETWTRGAIIGGLGPSFRHLPVGSNLPDARAERQRERERLNITDGQVVLATFGTAHPSRLMGHVTAAANRVAAEDVDVVLLNLGDGATPLHDLDHRVTEMTPGLLSDRDVAAMLAAADLYLAPFIDGVSTRRTSLVAALQQALPVVGTDGHNTGVVMRNAAGMQLVDVGDIRGFSDCTAALAMDAGRRHGMAGQARVLFDRHFAWSVIAQSLVSDLSQVVR